MARTIKEIQQDILQRLMNDAELWNITAYIDGAPKPPIGIMPLWLWKEKNPNPTFEDIANRGYEIIAARKRGAKID